MFELDRQTYRRQTYDNHVPVAYEEESMVLAATDSPDGGGGDGDAISVGDLGVY